MAFEEHDEPLGVAGRPRGRVAGLELLAVPDGGGAEPDHHVAGLHRDHVFLHSHQPPQGEHALGERVVQHFSPRPPQGAFVGVLVADDVGAEFVGGFPFEDVRGEVPRLALGAQFGDAGDGVEDRRCGGDVEHGGTWEGESDRKTRRPRDVTMCTLPSGKAMSSEMERKSVGIG
ncbi:MAG TPA: hypothetical protein VMZ71_06270 [Gemmataceae bacterium]|nr:hypothetical protein [Gemmataceae bacterium]